MRDSFVFYRSFAEAINKLDQDNRLNVYDALCRYALDGEIVTDNGIVKAMLTLMIPQIDANNRRYENGKKGGRNKNQSETKPEPNPNQTRTKMEPKETKPEPNVNVNVNDNVNDNDIKDKRKRFTPPTLEEVKSYCQERKNSVDPERFINFYESKGWVVGKSPMKDWKAAVRNWEKDSKVVTTNKFKNFDERSYDMDALEAELVAKSMSKGNY
jgi:hypothetical protein